MHNSKRLVALMLTVMMLLTMGPAFAFAEDQADSPVSGSVQMPAEDPEEDIAGDEDYVEGELFEGEGSFSEIFDADEINGGDPAALMEKYLLRDKLKASSGQAPKAPLSVKGDRLTGNNLKYYNLFKKILTEVNAGKRTATSLSTPITKIVGKKKITAKSLGLSKLATVKNGRLVLTGKSEKKIMAMMMPEDWGRVYTSLLSDFSNDSYWVDWYNQDYFFQFNYYFVGNAEAITIKAARSPLYYRLPVMPEFAASTYVVDRSKLNAVSVAKNNAATIVSTFDDYARENMAGVEPEIIDLYRLWYYCNVVANLTEYDDVAFEAAKNDSAFWRGPWSLVSVLDGDSSTKAVCVGYARAFKYLCDLSTFKSKWIDCQIASGEVYSISGMEGHMWNIVRMNDGLNYLVDPTWADTGVQNEADTKWFLRGAPAGTANEYTIEGRYRVYDAWMKSSFAPAERTLSKMDYYQVTKDKAIVLKKPKITKLYKKSKSFKIKWKPVSTPLGALYVDGYQIQYSTKKSMKSAKNIYIKGYAKSSKLIKKLKKNKKYYVRIRTYAKIGKTTVYSSWSKKKSVRTK